MWISLRKMSYEMASFKRIDNGYRVPASYVGYGYAIDVVDNFGVKSISIYNIEDVKFDADGCLDAYDVKVVRNWDLTVTEAKSWCMRHAR